jgi:hypothetical protein
MNEFQVNLQNMNIEINLYVIKEDIAMAVV